MSIGIGLRPAEVKSAFRYREQIQAMMTDPDLTGDVLLVAVAMAHRCQFAAETGKPFRKWADLVGDLGWEMWDLRMALHEDIPRYEVPRNRSVICGAPMLRREGTCDRPAAASLVFSDRDPDTGEGRQLGFCSRHGALQHETKARMKAWHANGCPQPPHNAGGVLARYFNGLESAYVWANHGRELTPGEGKPVEIPKPVFTLIRGGAA